MNSRGRDLTYLENSIARANSQLSLFENKLNQFERNLENSSLTNQEFDEIEDACVIEELLLNMTEVQNEYLNLKKDITEVKKLQTEMTTSIRFQMRSLQNTFRVLKKRIESNASKN